MIVRVDGWLVGEAVGQLRETCSGLTGSVRLDITDLRSADDQGLVFLRGLARLGAEIVGASPYIALRLGLTRTAEDMEKSD